MTVFLRAAFVVLALLAAPPAAHAILTCDLDGRPVNPNNGNTTAGQSGLMRCRDADTGLVQREQELKNGVFVGVVRFFEGGQLAKEFRVNERGNRDGPYREWSVVDGKRVLVREEEANRNGTTVGLVRAWYPNGQKRRVTWYDDDGREGASVEFADGDKPSDLRCAKKPVLGRDFDDRAACGFAGAKTTTLYDAKGRPQARVTFENGERRKSEQLAADGSVRDVRETTGAGGYERSYYANGAKRRETEFTTVASSDGGRPRHVTLLEREYHESGQVVRERRYAPSDRGADLVAETRLYLNGQPKEETLIVSGPQGRVRREKAFFDNGRLASEGDWVASGRRGDALDRPVGTHRSYDERGVRRGETVYDDRGRPTRERTYDERGDLARDDEVYEDGSRKSVGR